MSSVFPTIVAILFGLSFEEFYAETAMPEESLVQLLLALTLCLVPVAAAEILFLFARRRFARGRPYDVRPFARWVQAAPLPLYALAIFGFGWPKIVVPLGVEGTVLVDHMVVLAPFFLVLFAALIETARLRRPQRLRDNLPYPVKVSEVLGPVLDVFRHLGLVVVPLFGLILVLDIARDTPLRLYFNHLPLLSSVCLLLALFGLAVLYPLMFRYGLGLKPLVAGAPLRRRLEELAANLDFRCRDILYWSPRRPVLNAAIVGVLPRWRYVVLTDELCKRLTLEELGAVFTHEVGHGKRHHAPMYLMFAVAFFTILIPLGDWAGGLVMEWTDARIDASVAATVLVYVPLFALYWLALFSHLSRRFELEADVYGVQATQDPALFITTLEKVARLSRVEQRRRTRHHFSIASRTDFLRRAFIEREPHLLAGFRRRIGLARRVIVWSSAAVLFAAFLWLLLDSIRGAGAIFLERREDASAERSLGFVVAVRPGDMVAKALLAEADLYREPGPAGVASENWRLLEAAEGDLGPVERSAVLDTLRVGWARALVRDRPDRALVLIDRACWINRVRGQGERTIFDFDLAETLVQMAALTEALRTGDGPRARRFVEHPPRWLRRADVHSALDYASVRAGEHEEL